MGSLADELLALRETWQQRWEESLAIWSRYTRICEPRWCFDENEEKAQGLTDSFAMIRLTDQAIVISLPRVHQSHLQAFPREILCHEIGHHILCPGDLTDLGRALARIRKGLPTKEHLAGFVCNLYTDLLVNNHLQRSAGLDMAGVYRTLGKGSQDRLWNFYMRIYEILWSLERGTLTNGEVTREMDGDAMLGARLVRMFHRDWVRGSGRFACLCLTYLLPEDGLETRGLLGGWMDTLASGVGGEPTGLAEAEDDEDQETIHPALDPLLNKEAQEGGATQTQDESGGAKNRSGIRDISEYGEILKALGIEGSDQDIAVRYYRERAMPHLIRFPMQRVPETMESQPEGLHEWDFGDGLENADWFESVIRSPMVIPGVTTVQRLHGEVPAKDPGEAPIDLYIGVDCSGSMPNPTRTLSYPALAAVILALSALRASARVKVVLSGEPGKTFAMPDFSRDSVEILRTVTTYLGTGTAFGIHRLQDTFRSKDPVRRPAHILIVTDNDIFRPLDSIINQRLGWSVAEEALQVAKGGGTLILHTPGGSFGPMERRLQDIGWSINHIQGWEELVEFARTFSRRVYGKVRQ